MKKLTFVKTNEIFIPHITVKKLTIIKKTTKLTSIEGGIGTARLTTFIDEIGINYFSYGILMDNLEDRPGHKGEWSSNSYFMSNLFNIFLIPIALQKEGDECGNHWFAMAIKKSDIELPNNLEWRMHYGSMSIMLKEDEPPPPKRNDYSRPTHLNYKGELKVGDKIVSDDYSAVGILTEINNKLFVVGDFGQVEYDEHNADWELHHIWKSKIDAERKAKGGFWKRMFNT